MGYAVRLADGAAVRLAEIDPHADGGLEKAAGEAALAPLAAEIGELQELLFAAREQSVLIVLQGLDASGKDGTVRNVLREVNPAGCRVVSFKAPTPHELAHDFLWRIHRETPERGYVVAFNRSHYEDVLVPRVRGTIDEATWRGRYEAINAFERLLVGSGTLLLKCYLHISEAEQEERLLARERDVTKAWKLNAGDWLDRRSWAEFRVAYEDALAATATPEAPWHIIPADRKWFRNLAVAEALVGLLRPQKARWLETLRLRGEAELAEIRAMRGGGPVASG